MICKQGVDITEIPSVQLIARDSIAYFIVVFGKDFRFSESSISLKMDEAFLVYNVLLHSPKLAFLYVHIVIDIIPPRTYHEMC